MNYFRLHGNCMLVKGAARALIYDLFRYRTLGLSLPIAELYETEMLHLPLDQVLDKYAAFRTELLELVDTLIAEDFGFFTDEPERFPVISTRFKGKKRLYSAVIELDMGALRAYGDLFAKLTDLDCSVFYLLVREEIKDLEGFGQLLAAFKESRATWVQVIFDQPYLSVAQLKQVTHDMRVRYQIFNAGKDETVSGRWWLEESPYQFPLIQYQSRAFELYRKSEYGVDHFYPTQAVFLESQAHNPFFNAKVCINKAGAYKNDLAFAESFGNFRSRSLEALLLDESFTRLWRLSNDRIEKCRDCQFRYQCISNSDIREEDGRFYKVDTCTFDPYTNQWYET